MLAEVPPDGYRYIPNILDVMMAPLYRAYQEVGWGLGVGGLEGVLEDVLQGCAVEQPSRVASSACVALPDMSTSHPARLCSTVPKLWPCSRPCFWRQRGRTAQAREQGVPDHHQRKLQGPRMPEACVPRLLAPWLLLVSFCMCRCSAIDRRNMCSLASAVILESFGSSCPYIAPCCALTTQARVKRTEAPLWHMAHHGSPAAELIARVAGCILPFLACQLPSLPPVAAPEAHAAPALCSIWALLM
jgi:hypothetical protein